MDRINLKKFRFIYPLFADEFVGSQAPECFESAVEVAFVLWYNSCHCDFLNSSKLLYFLASSIRGFNSSCFQGNLIYPHSFTLGFLIISQVIGFLIKSSVFQGFKSFVSFAGCHLIIQKSVLEVQGALIHSHKNDFSVVAIQVGEEYIGLTLVVHLMVGIQDGGGSNLSASVSHLVFIVSITLSATSVSHLYIRLASHIFIFEERVL